MQHIDQATSNVEYPDWLNRREYPFESHVFEQPMGRMHYVDEGEGEPIIMVHGNPGWSFEFRDVIKTMSATHRCIAPDHIGFGLSDKPFEWDYMPTSQAENFERFMESLDLDGITLIVNDWGGPIGLSYAINHPEKIKRLIILNTWLWSVADDWYYQGFSGFMGGAIGRFLIKHFNFFGKQVVKQAVGDSRKLDREIHAHYYLHLATKEDRKGNYIFPREIVGSSKWLDSLWQQREKINQIPTHFIWGMKDIAFREKELNHWLKHWPNAEVTRLPEVGHYPQEEATEVVIGVLEGK